MLPMPRDFILWGEIPIISAQTTRGGFKEKAKTALKQSTPFTIFYNHNNTLIIKAVAKSFKSFDFI